MESNSKKNNLLIVILLSAVFGLISGFTGELAARTFFQDLFISPYLGEINFSNGSYKGSNLVIRDPKKVVVEQNDKVSDVVNSVQGSLVGIFKKNTSLNKQPDKQAGDFDIENYYLAGQESGQGLIITSDGWIITNIEMDDGISNYAVVTSDKKVYEIDSALSDKLTSFNFIHVKANDFPVRRFSDEAAKNGQLAVEVNWHGGSLLTSVINYEKSKDPVISSDAFFNKISLSGNLSGSLAVFNLGGDVIGLAEKNGKVEPIGHFVSAINSLLKNKAVKRPSLGIYYIDLSTLADKNFGSQNLKKYQKGALIYGKDEKTPAVSRGGSAYLAGLKEGDVILEIDGVEINGGNNLTEKIQSYAAGDTVDITYERESVTGEISIKLGEIK